ncbi:MAG: DNA repair protein RadC [Bacteroidales bacterium]|jgi:DNA repair protein RadC|nr:DNA repair protein RadC [Bacteroidales bacterium]
MRIKELCADERPREKMFSKGPGAMSNAELLAILIGSGTKKENVLEVANRLLASAGGNLSSLAAMDRTGITAMDGIGSGRYASIAAAFELGRRCCLEDPGVEKVPLTDPRMVFRLMTPKLRGLDHEEFWVIFLNRANYVIHKEMISLGGMSSTVVDPRLVIRKALDKRACGIILVHNHPSGNPRPGQNDLEQTAAIKKAAETFNISLLDHVIICDDMYFCFSEDKVYLG